MAVSVEEFVPDENYLGPPIFHLKSDKFKAEFSVSKSNDGYSFYEIKCTKGTLAKELESKFSSYQRAIDHFECWEQKQISSKAVQRDNRAEAIKQEKALDADKRSAS